MDPSITSPEPSSPATTLPHELVEMIIAHLIHDTSSLRACTLTCRSWYTATVPHPHHDLFIGSWEEVNLKWPAPLWQKYKLGLLPFVKTFWIRGLGMAAFTGGSFYGDILYSFSALNNLQRLMIDHLDIPNFMPAIRQHFGHFSPTIRELCLTDPRGSHRQITFFVGLFEHLEDLSIVSYWHDFQGKLGATRHPSHPSPLQYGDG